VETLTHGFEAEPGGRPPGLGSTAPEIHRAKMGPSGAYDEG